MKAAVTFINNFLIILRKALRVLFKSKALNFFYLFIMFKMSFLIIYKSGFIAYLYLKLFILLRFVYDFSKKKLCCNMSTFFYIVRAACHLEQSLDNVII